MMLMGWVLQIAAAQTPTVPSSPIEKSAVTPPLPTNPLLATRTEKAWTLTGVSPADELPQDLSSQQVAAQLARMAYERYRAADASANQTAQAWILYRAALSLNPRIAIEEDLIRVATSIPDQDLSSAVQWAYHAYASNPALDMEVAQRAVRYQLDRLQDPDSWIRRYAIRLAKTNEIIDRDLRERLIIKLLEIAQTRNAVLTADLTIQGAQIIREKSNFPAVAQLAVSAQASDPYQLGVIPLILQDPEVYNSYMRIQMERVLTPQKRQLVKQNDVLYKVALEKYEILSFLRFRRLALLVDPMDPEAAAMFARFAENQRLYDLAAAGYEYSAALGEYGSVQDPDRDKTLMQIHYRNPTDREICLQIAERIRRSGRFDPMVEGLAAKAADHLGRPEQARAILDQTQQRIEQLLAEDPNSDAIRPPILATYYAFVDPNPEKALASANIARQRFPQVPQIRSLFGYALSMSADPNLARDYVQDLTDQDSIAALTVAKLALAGNDKKTAIPHLLQAVEIDSSLLAVEQAVQILTDLGQAPPSTLAPEDRKILEDEFSQALAPSFIPPAKRFAVKFSVGGNSTSMSYGREIKIYLSIQNLSSDPILFRDYGLFKGRLRIDAFVRGDLTRDIPRLIETRILPFSPIAPGKSMLIPLQIDTGSLARLIWTHPQANLEIELVGYLDPVPGEADGVRNPFPDVPPARITLKRTGLPLSRAILMERLDSVSKGQTAQKIQAAREMAGLWMEQLENSRSGIPYRYYQIDPVVYLDALRLCLGNEDWVVVTTTLSVLDAMSDPVPYEMVQIVSPLLHNPNWPVRMMAMNLLSRSGPGQFQKVLDWIAASDTHPLVKDLAKTMGVQKVSIDASKSPSGVSSFSPPALTPESGQTRK
ncbi:MAG: hypothetical protein GX455_01450 [Phycisphaerae bacterium]|nr:hypothetical protein [Phycisphaerae bacterium]